MGSWSNPDGPAKLTEWRNDKSGWRLNWGHYSEFTGLADMSGLNRAAVSHIEDAKHHTDKLTRKMKEMNRARDA